MKRILFIGLTAFILLFSLSGIAAAAPDINGGLKAHTTWHLKPATATSVPTGLSPAQVLKAYNFQTGNGGAGMTIAIIDAYDNPNAQTDLDAFSRQFGLPLTTDRKFTFSKVKIGSVPGDTGWGLEIALDIQWAHAMAPNANILLVEAASSSLSNLLAAVNYAKSQPSVVAVSMSWGAGEWLSESSYDSYFNSSHGEVYFAASGDSGAAVIWPSAAPNVVAVGGTTLNVDSTGNPLSETGWSGSGGGISKYESEPSYQSTYGILGANGKRCIPDVSYDADPNTGFSVLDSYGYGGWVVVGGTSAGAPQWAAIQALGLSSSNPNFYTDAKSSGYSSYFRDITTGSAGKNSAATGYDYVTGLGSPVTTNFTPAATADFTISISPSSLSVGQGTAKNATITLTSLNGFNSSVSLSASGQPSGVTVTFGANPVTPTGSSVMTVSAAANAAPGNYTVTVKGISGSLSHSANLTLTVVNTTPDFSISASPSSQTITGNGSTTYTITVAAINGYSGNVGLSVSSGLPSRATASFNPASVTGSGTSTLTIKVNQRQRGTYTVTIRGTDGTLSHSTTVKLVER